MYMHKIFVASVLMMSMPLLSTAQDKIYKKQGEVINAKVRTVGPRTITYVRFDNQAGAEYTVAKRDVDRIVYQDGTTDNVNGGRIKRDNTPSTAGSKMAYRPNILALAPVQFTNLGLGAGLSYERSLDPNGIVALYIPAMMVMNLSNNTYYNPSTGLYDNGNQDMMFYAMPGIKVYPTGNQGVVRYAIGPSVSIASGQDSREVYPIAPGYPVYVTQSRFMLGMVINNSLNINPSPRIYMGIELGFGFNYINRIEGVNQNANGIAQGSFKIGYRF